MQSKPINRYSDRSTITRFNCFLSSIRIIRKITWHVSNTTRVHLATPSLILQLSSRNLLWWSCIVPTLDQGLAVGHVTSRPGVQPCLLLQTRHQAVMPQLSDVSLSPPNDKKRANFHMTIGGAFNKQEVGFEDERTMQSKAPGARKRISTSQQGEGLVMSVHMCGSLFVVSLSTQKYPIISLWFFSLTGWDHLVWYICKIQGQRFYVQVYVQV